MGTLPRDYIEPGEARHLYGLFRERVRRSPDAVAYRWFDADAGSWAAATWAETAAEVGRWQVALTREGLQRGDRVAVMLRNCREWILFDQAAMGLGLVTVPLYADDRPDNAAYILLETEAKLLILRGADAWRGFYKVRDQMTGLKRVVTLEQMTGEPHDHRLRWLQDWLPEGAADLADADVSADELASIVYTSGTTGRPKGVMLTHGNLLWDAWASVRAVAVYPDDLFLSFLPLSHTLERTGGCYAPMLGGAGVAFARSILQLGEDLRVVRPTVLVAVPRVFERVYDRIQRGLKRRSRFARWLFHAAVASGWHRFLHRQGRVPWSPILLWWPLLDMLVGRKVRARLGGRLRVAISGGAPLPPPVARLFIGLGLNIIQGYGLTEASPVVCGNRLDDNEPASVGTPLDGVEVRLGENSELLVRGPNVMQGYWHNRDATDAAIDEDGWLHTGDQARIEHGRIYLTGRLKDIIVLSSGEKVAPADMEMALTLDPLIDQVMVLGEGKSYLSALVVLNREVWQEEASARGLSNDPCGVDAKELERLLKRRLAPCLEAFPGYARLRRFGVCTEAWSIGNGLLTPTMKPRRERILEAYAELVDGMYPKL
jgi:long-chain acyl-CoA synthetase